MVVSEFALLVFLLLFVVLSLSFKALLPKTFDGELVPIFTLGFLGAVVLTVLWCVVATCCVNIEKVPMSLVETYEIITIENGYTKKHIFMDKYGKVHWEINGYYPEACIVEHYKTVPVWRYGMHFCSVDYYKVQ